MEILTKREQIASELLKALIVDAPTREFIVNTEKGAEIVTRFAAGMTDQLLRSLNSELATVEDSDHDRLLSVLHRQLTAEIYEREANQAVAESGDRDQNPNTEAGVGAV